MGTYRDVNEQIVPVAIKILKRGHYSFNDIVREIKLIDSCGHPNIIELIGYIHNSDEDVRKNVIVMVTEFMDGGDLNSYLINDQLVRY